MTTTTLTETDWAIRLYIYRHFVEHGRPPAHAETAEHLRIAPDEAQAAYHRLNDAHAIVLERGTDEIRLANPLSARPTPYRVHVGGAELYAACAWDSLGVPAMLHADARIEAAVPGSDEPVQYAVESGQLLAPEGLVVHFSVPFRRWYVDRVHT